MKNDCRKIAKTALFSYAGEREYRAFICRADFLPGSGDFEDADKTADDKQIQCFELCFEDFLSSGKICASGGFFETLQEAVSRAEKSAGFVKWL